MTILISKVQMQLVHLSLLQKMGLKKAYIENSLLREMSLVLGNEKEKIKVSLFNDVEYLKAAELILDKNEYNKFIIP